MKSSLQWPVAATACVCALSFTGAISYAVITLASVSAANSSQYQQDYSNIAPGTMTQDLQNAQPLPGFQQAQESFTDGQQYVFTCVASGKMWVERIYAYTSPDSNPQVTARDFTSQPLCQAALESDEFASR